MHIFQSSAPWFIPFFLLFIITNSAFAEFATWMNDFTELLPDGTCWVAHVKDQKREPPNTVYKGPSRQYPNCGDPDYTKMKQCQMANFYKDQEPAKSEVMTSDKMDDALLLLLDGCLSCPYGSAQANVTLVNNLPSGGMLSSCWDQRLEISSLTVRLAVDDSADVEQYQESYGTFALGGILRERDCGMLGLFDGRKMAYEGLVLEVRHNCGRKRPMLLKVRLPKVVTPSFRDHGKMGEMTGLSLNLAIYGPGWDERTVEYGLVRPRQPLSRVVPNAARDGHRGIPTANGRNRQNPGNRGPASNPRVPQQPHPDSVAVVTVAPQPNRNNDDDIHNNHRRRPVSTVVEQKPTNIGNKDVDNTVDNAGDNSPSPSSVADLSPATNWWWPLLLMVAPVLLVVAVVFVGCCRRSLRQQMRTKKKSQANQPQKSQEMYADEEGSTTDESHDEKRSPEFVA